MDSIKKDQYDFYANAEEISAYPEKTRIDPWVREEEHQKNARLKAKSKKLKKKKKRLKKKEKELKKLQFNNANNHSLSDMEKLKQDFYNLQQRVEHFEKNEKNKLSQEIVQCNDIKERSRLMKEFLEGLYE